MGTFGFNKRSGVPAVVVIDHTGAELAFCRESATEPSRSWSGIQAIRCGDGRNTSRSSDRILLRITCVHV